MPWALEGALLIIEAGLGDICLSPKTLSITNCVTMSKQMTATWCFRSVISHCLQPVYIRMSGSNGCYAWYKRRILSSYQNVYFYQQMISRAPEADQGQLQWVSEGFCNNEKHILLFCTGDNIDDQPFSPLSGKPPCLSPSLSHRVPSKDLAELGAWVSAAAHMENLQKYFSSTQQKFYLFQVCSGKPISVENDTIYCCCSLL